MTHCPTCGVKLHRTDLSLCAYCASPLKMGASATPPDDETQRLLQKIESHPNYAASLQWTPLDPAIEARSLRLGGIASTLIVLGLVVFAGGAVFDPSHVWTSVTTLISAGLVAFALGLLLAAGTMRSHARRQPMLRRASRVLDRRSRTELSDKVGATIYYFQLRFADGSEGEFRFLGRGTLYEPPTVGASGVAYTRGADMIEFKRF